MTGANTGSPLLTAILAAQFGFISRDELLAAAKAWVSDKSQDIAEILSARDSLTVEELSLLQCLARKHLANHNGDGEKALTALSSISSFCGELAGLDDDVDKALAFVSSDRRTMQRLLNADFRGR